MKRNRVVWMRVNRNGNPVLDSGRLPIYWLRKVARLDAQKGECVVPVSIGLDRVKAGKEHENG
ncbi:MAG: hypothetical protein LLG20_18375 [Acidobacteriales bacterium]|nr:hypothetical protein [Terriglobales bacterium]